MARQTIDFTTGPGAFIDVILQKFLVRRWKALARAITNKRHRTRYGPNDVQFWIRLFRCRILPRTWGQNISFAYSNAHFFADFAWTSELAAEVDDPRSQNQVNSSEDSSARFKRLWNSGGDFAAELKKYCHNMTQGVCKRGLEEECKRAKALKLRSLMRLGLIDHFVRPSIRALPEEDLHLVNTLFASSQGAYMKTASLLNECTLEFASAHVLQTFTEALPTEKLPERSDHEKALRWVRTVMQLETAPSATAGEAAFQVTERFKFEATTDDVFEARKGLRNEDKIRKAAAEAITVIMRRAGKGLRSS